MIQFNVQLLDATTQRPVGGAVVRIDTLPALAIFPPTRTVNLGGPGTCNFYNGPPIPPAQVVVSVDAAGYIPWTNGDTPVTFSDQTLLVTASLQPFKAPFVAAPRSYEGNMCGTSLAGLPAIPGGAADPDLVISWLVFRYALPDRQRIYADHRAKSLLDFLVSWPDFQNAGGTPAGFATHCREVLAAGLRPCVMLSAKPTSSADVRDVQGTLANILLVLPLLVGTVPRFCVGWELSLWLSPADVQFLIDQLTPLWLTQAGTRGYVHFQAGYFAYQPDGQQTGAFWQANVGKLHGILHQRHFDDSPDFPSYQARIVDCLQRFDGQFNCPADSGFGSTFDFIALEITAMAAFNDGLPEADQNAWGQAALTTPPVGAASVLGSGNGF